MLAGNHRKALAALSGPTARVDDYTQQVHVLFPAEPPAPDGAQPPRPPPDKAEAEAALVSLLRRQNTSIDQLVSEAIARMAPLSQPGPSGLRKEHLRLAWDTIPTFPELFSALIRRIVVGDLCGELVTRSTLSLVPKPGGGCRPIGVGEVVRRIAGRIVASGITPAVRSTFEQGKQYVLSQFGTALAYRRILRLATSRKWILQVDLRNAFNEVSRAAVIRHAPSEALAGPIIETLYAQPSLMMIPRLAVARAIDRGVIQGCPLGSLLFAAALQPIADAAGRDLPVEQTWYADDGHIAAEDVTHLETYLSRFATLAEQSGLRLSFGPTKTRLLSPQPVAPLSAEAFPSLAALPLTHQITSLGGPVVSMAHADRAAAVQAAWEALVDGVAAKIAPIGTMLDPQHMISLLTKAGAWSRVRYHVAARDEPLPLDLCRRLVAAERRIVACALGPFGAFMEDGSHPFAWARVILPQSLGGLGLPSVTHEAVSAAAYDRLILDAIETGHLGDAAANRDQRDVARTTRYRSLQHFMLGSMQPALRPLYLDIAMGSGTALLGLTATPLDGTLLEKPLAELFFAIFLGLPVLTGHDGCTVCLNAPRSDPYAVHFTGCLAVRTSRHNRVRDVLAALLRRNVPSGNVVTETTVNNLGEPIAPVDGLRPVDLGYHRAEDASWHLYDIIVQSQHAAGAVVPPRLMSSNADALSSPLAALGRLRKAAKLNRRGFHNVTPLAFGALGGVDAGTRGALRLLHSTVAARGAHVGPNYVLGKAQFAIWRPLLMAVASHRSGTPFLHSVRPRSNRRRHAPPTDGRGRSTNVPSRIDPSPPSPEPAVPAPRRAVQRRARSAAPPAEHRPAVDVCHTAALWEAMAARPRPDVVKALSRLAHKTCEALYTEWPPIVAEVRTRLRVLSAGSARRPLSAALDGATRRALLGLDLPGARSSLNRLNAWSDAICGAGGDPAIRTFLREGGILIESADTTRLDARPSGRVRSPRSAHGCSAARRDVSSSPSDGGFSRSSSVSTSAFAHSVSDAE
jgi:hypothetical protein